ncbi:MAG: hypothetical protein P8123_03470 [bacterium]|jgi:hypothetical protein
MQELSTTDGFGKLTFEKDERLMHGKMSLPLAERILRRWPGITSLLAAVGARGVSHGSWGEHGDLAVMMAASRSIDAGGRHRKNYRFCVR